MSSVAWAQPKSDWEREQEERDWKEQAVKLPPYPEPARLVEFYVSAAASFRFYIDAASLSVGDDGVVRYALVARSPSGSDNVSFEGIRCRNGHYRVYAYGRADRTWVARDTEWKAIEPKTMNRQHQALRREYFCPQSVPISSAAEGIDALKRGGHPFAKGRDRE